MSLPDPELGLVIRYGYLWKEERARGVEEGRKDRPCAIIMSVVSAEGTRRVGVCPITHSPPLSPEDGVAVPLATARRLGLDDNPCWIIVSQINTFQWPGHDIRPDRDDKVSLGFLPPKLFEIIKERLIERAQENSLGSVNRD